MTTLPLGEAQALLARLVERLRPGEEITISVDRKPVARLTAPAEGPKPPRELGTMRGSVLWMAPDFDAPLDEFREYMP